MGESNSCDLIGSFSGFEANGRIVEVPKRMRWILLSDQPALDYRGFRRSEGLGGDVRKEVKKLIQRIKTQVRCPERIK